MILLTFAVGVTHERLNFEGQEGCIACGREKRAVWPRGIRSATLIGYSNFFQTSVLENSLLLQVSHMSLHKHIWMHNVRDSSQVSIRGR